MRKKTRKKDIESRFEDAVDFAKKKFRISCKQRSKICSFAFYSKITGLNTLQIFRSIFCHLSFLPVKNKYLFAFPRWTCLFPSMR
jgi:hypothetical protein